MGSSRRSPKRKRRSSQPTTSHARARQPASPRDGAAEKPPSRRHPQQDVPTLFGLTEPAVAAVTSQQAATRRRHVLLKAAGGVALLVALNVLAGSPVTAALKPDSTCTISRRTPPKNTIADVAVGPGRHLVAVGWVTGLDGKDGAVWSSPPATPSPTPVDTPTEVFGGEGDQYVHAVIPYGSGFLAVGSDSDHAAIWTSLDGRRWDRQNLDAAVGGNKSAMRTVIEAANGLVVGGWVCLGDPAGRQPAVWTAEQGTDWKRTELPAAKAFPIDPDAPEAQVNDVVEAGSRLIAVGTVRTKPIVGRAAKVNWDAAIWTYGGGPDWHVVNDVHGDHGPADQYMNSVTVWPGGMVAVGGEGFLRGTNTAMWFSSDGRLWERQRQLFDRPYMVLREAQSINSVTAVDGILFAVGYAQPLGEKAAPKSRMWSSTDGRNWIVRETSELRSEARSVQPLSAGGGIVAGWRQGPLDRGRQGPWIESLAAVPATLAVSRHAASAGVGAP
jgi:hypothetical protein